MKTLYSAAILLIALASCNSGINTSVSSRDSATDDVLALSGPQNVERASEISFTWQQPAGVGEFSLAISTRSDCTAPIISVSGLNVKEYKVTISQAGTFYVCLKAFTANGTLVAESQRQIIVNDSDSTKPVSLDASQLSSANSISKSAYEFSAKCSGNETYVIEARDSNSKSSDKKASCVNGMLNAAVDLKDLADGDITFTVFNESKTVEITSSTINKDTSEPSVNISNLEQGDFANNTNLAAFVVAGTCSENGKDVTVTIGSAEESTTCSAGNFSVTLDLSAEPAGSLNISVSHVDSAGNVSSENSLTITKDTTTALTVTNGAGSYINSADKSSYEISGTCSEDTQSVSISGPVSATESCSSGSYAATLNLSAIADGTLNFTIRHEASNGNFDQKTISLVKDTVAPTPSFSGTPSATVTGSSISVTVGGANVLGYKYDLLSGGAANCSGAAYGPETAVADPISESISSDDSYRLCIISYDAAGNASPVSEIAFTRDTLPSGAFDVTGLASFTNNPTPSISWGASAGSANYRLLVDDNNDCSSPVQTYSNLTGTTKSLANLSSDGTYYVCLTAFDAAGNERNASTYPASFTVETQAPNTPSAPTDNGAYDDTTVTFNWTSPSDNGSAGIASFYIQVGTSAGASDVYAGNVGTDTSYEFTGTNGNTYYIRVKAIDNAGNESAYSSNSNGVMVDATPPTAASALKEAPDATGDADGDSDNDTSVYLVWSAGSDADSGLAASDTYRVYWYDQASCTGSVTEVDTTGFNTQISGLSDGSTYSFKVRTFDNAANYSDSACSDGIRIDTTNPPALTSFVGSTGSSAGEIDLSFDFPADVSDYDNIKIYRSSSPSASSGVVAPGCGSGTLVSTITDFSTDPLTVTDDTEVEDQYFSYRACIYDAAGNSYSSNTAIDAQSKGLTVLLHLDARKIDGSDNSGDIGALTSSTWTDSVADNDGSLVSFNFNTDKSGWDGDGSVGDPYRLKFDGAWMGSNDFVNAGTISLKSFSIWFNADVTDSTSASVMTLIGSGHNRVLVYVGSGNLVVEHKNTFSASTGVVPNVWYNLTMTSDGTTTKFYLDGVHFASTEQGYIGTSTLSLGKTYLSAIYFDGAIADFIGYDDTLSEEKIRSLYLEGRSRFYADPGTLTIERLINPWGPTTGGNTTTAFGWNLSDVNAVTVGGASADSFTVSDTPGEVLFEAPSGAVGLSDIVVSDASESDTLTTVYKYTATPTDNLTFLLDAANIDTIGGHGPSRSDVLWKSLVSAYQPKLFNFNFGTADSGWTGDGSTGDPYRLHFDGSNDAVNIGVLGPQSYSIWFNADTIPTGSTRCIICGGNNASNTLLLTVGDGAVKASYGASTTYSSAISTGNWYNVTVANDGTTVRFYLNGTEFGSEAEPVIPRYTRYLGKTTGFSYGFDGSIAELRMYEDYLIPSEVSTIYTEGSARFP